MKYEKQLNAILGLYGIKKWQRDEFITQVLSLIQDHVMDQVCGYAKQLMLDATALALNESEGIGAARWARIEKAIRDKVEQLDILSEEEAIENMRFQNVDENGRPDFFVIKYQIDQVLRPIYGENMLEYDERYKKAQEESTHSDWKRLEKIAKGGKQ